MLTQRNIAALYRRFHVVASLTYRRRCRFRLALRTKNTNSNFHISNIIKRVPPQTQHKQARKRSPSISESPASRILAVRIFSLVLLNVVLLTETKVVILKSLHNCVNFKE